ncbi:MAG TPA: hypothetical protein VL173_16155 [Vicinamibacterales bacterium]|jgi:hypothetical protein|nr:hypothetical protein [Vicinamibacterales bacterium]
MVRSLLLLPALSLALLAAGCGSDTPTAPADTPAVQVTETLFGTVTVNGGATSTFDEAKAGSVTVQLTALTPDDTVKVGLQLGTWNGTSCAISSVVKDDAVLNSVLLGTATGPGTLCVRVYDVGALTQPTDFEVRVDHY